MAQPLVLAIEPDLRQAAILKRILREKALADIAVVDSRDAAMEAMRSCMPDVLLLSALMSPRDEDELMAHLKTLDNAGHLQTHTIPQLASTLGPGDERASRGLLSAFRRKKDSAPLVAGCDPELFAEEIGVFLQRAADRKRQLQKGDFTAPDMRPSAVATSRAAAAPVEEVEATPSSSWSSPFEWKPAGSSARSTRAPEAAAAKPAAKPAAQQPARPAPASTTPFEADPPIPMSASGESSVADPPIPESFVVPEPALAQSPVVVAEPLMPEAPVVRTSPAAVEAPHVDPPAAEPIVRAAAEPVTAPEPKPVPAAPPVATKAAPQPSRPKAVAERAAKSSPRGQLQGLLQGRVSKERERERLGSLARWARSEAPRNVKSAPVTADDVRSLISSLAVPSAVASVTYPRGCRIRRLRVPVSPDHDSSKGGGPAAFSRRTSAEQRDKQPSA